MIDNKNILNLCYLSLVKLVLEVFGASGAVWGFAEVLTMRNSETIEFWRWVCVAVAIVFFIRYCVVMFLLIKNSNNKK